MCLNSLSAFRLKNSCLNNYHNLMGQVEGRAGGALFLAWPTWVDPWHPRWTPQNCQE